MRLVYFAGTALPTAAEDVSIPSESRSSLLELNNGAFDEDGQPNVLRPVTLTRSFKVTPAVDATLDGLMGVFASGRKVLKAVLRDNSTYRQTFAKATRIERPRNAADASLQRVEVTFAQDYPYWMATADEPRYLDNGEVIDGTWTLDGNYTNLTIDTLSETTTITNNGNVPIPRGKIIFRPNASASITNIKITNTTNWMWLKWTGTLTYPQVLVLDLLPKSAKVDSTNSYANITVPSGQMDWLILEVGANAITIDMDARSGNTAWEWHWSKHYV